MIGEISSLVQNLQPSTRDLSEQSSVGRASKGQGVAAAQQVGGRPIPGTRQVGEQEDRPGDARKLEGEELDGTVSDLNVLAQQMHRELRFAVDEDSGEVVVKVIDSETDEVLRQIPPEEVLKLRERLIDAAGVIFRGSV